MTTKTNAPANNKINTGQFKPGQSGNPDGRPVGSRNRFTALKESFVEAFDRIGGIDNLVEWAKGNQDKFYPLMVRIFPKEVEINEKSTADMHVSILEYNKAMRRIGEKEIED
tara:strand:- start:191 stop:526 length:336 start_codon:yes stop_codon:yes gene_type:complete